MRVIFAGHTGIEKRVAVGNLKTLVMSRLNIPNDPRHLYVDCVEDQIKTITGATGRAFLKSFNANYQLEAWNKAIATMTEVIEGHKSDRAFVCMHFTFYVDSRLFTLVDLGKIQRLNPTAIVTLIDDIYDVWGTIAFRDHRDNTKFRLRLREIAAWRSMETAMGELVSRFLRATGKHVPHYVVATKHPTEMLYRCLFQPTMPRFYASIPITQTRHDPERRAEIDAVRSELHKEFAVFDPLTIDEAAPTLFEKAQRNPSGNVGFQGGDPSLRWPIPAEGTLTHGRTNIYPFEIPAEEILEIKEDANELIKARDFSLIDSAHCLAGYRPNYGGMASQGMIAEFHHATSVPSPPKDIHFYSPPEDEQRVHPFTSFSERHATKAEWLNSLRAYRGT